MRSWGSLLPYFLYMARDYESEAMEKFLLPSQPDEGNFTSRMAYKTALKAYRCDHTRVMEVRERWKQSERIEDAHQEAVADKEHREAAEWSRKHRHLKEEGAEAGASIKHCKRCSAKGKSVCGTSSLC